ncbi:protein SRG1-like [Coffea eugenioides]|uniref:protein SRG1-like n=1 Tax=Coffea eugenioides TaxID=49369 RepID=UPI000F615E9C|nr:protein SRG1-like [Coffea eugenioides]
MTINQNSTEEELPNYGGSLSAPNVQEMVKRDPSKIPDRNIRSLEDQPKRTKMTSFSSEIPTVDLSLLLQQQEQELRKLDKACKEWGFFQVVNHGIENQVLQKIKDTARLFLDLPLEEKNKFSMPADDMQGYGHAFVFSEKQKLDWNDALVLFMFPSKFRKCKFWPTTPADFIDTVEKYSSEIRRVGMELLRSISINMGMASNTLLTMHKELPQALRLNNYPPCCKPDEVLGFSPHSDASTITVPSQDDDVTGLEIQHEGQWVPIRPIPNALVVNVGDVLEIHHQPINGEPKFLRFRNDSQIWSNGTYRSIEHRAVTNKNKARISFATFLSPQDDVEIEPLDTMMDSHGSLRKYKKVIFGDYIRKFFKAKLEGKSRFEMEKMELDSADLH